MIPFVIKQLSSPSSIASKYALCAWSAFLFVIYIGSNFLFSSLGINRAKNKCKFNTIFDSILWFVIAKRFRIQYLILIDHNDVSTFKEYHNSLQLLRICSLNFSIILVHTQTYTLFLTLQQLNTLHQRQLQYFFKWVVFLIR